MTGQEILARAREDNVRLISLQFTDVSGTIKSLTIPVERLPDAIKEGIWFDGSSIEGFTRIFESDMLLYPDGSTYCVLPWSAHDRRVARVVCDVCRPDGRPFEGDPRFVLKQMEKRAAAMGYQYFTGSELEFFLFQRDESGRPTTRLLGSGSYFDSNQGNTISTMRDEMMYALEQMGMEVEMAHHEVAPSQQEINIRFANALASADNAVNLRYTIKAIAYKNGAYATFMPKPLQSVNGSGMHTHQSLFTANGVNAFHAADQKYSVSTVGREFIAGQLVHARSMCAVLAPTVNSYKRLVPGFEAPVYICWGQQNRSALIRIPLHSGSPNATRAELRCPDPSANPYLAYAVMLAAGLDGIEKELVPPDPIDENAYEFSPEDRQRYDVNTLPGSLGEALAELEADPVIRGALGEHVYHWFMLAKRQEWDDYRTCVTQWELDRYLSQL
jgi:glutamine synthetase